MKQVWKKHFYINVSFYKVMSDFFLFLCFNHLVLTILIVHIGARNVWLNVDQNKRTSISSEESISDYEQVGFLCLDEKNNNNCHHLKVPIISCPLLQKL